MPFIAFIIRFKGKFMKKLTVEEIAKSFYGKGVNIKNYANLFESDFVFDPDYTWDATDAEWDLSDKHDHYQSLTYADETYGEYKECDVIERLGITEALLGYWAFGIEFAIELTTENYRITEASIFKYRETCEGPRPAGYEIQPTQQELRVFRRALEYITADETT